MILNRERLSEVLGCSLRTVDEYRRQGMPGTAPKRPGAQWEFDSAAVVTWLRDRERAEALGEVAKVDEGEAKRRKLAAEASLAELELALKSGAAVAISDFETAWAAMIGAARAKMLGLGAGLGQELALTSDPSDCCRVIDAAVKEALRELSEFSPLRGLGELSPDLQFDSAGDSIPAGEDSDDIEPVGSAPESDGERVGGRRKAVKPGIER